MPRSFGKLDKILYDKIDFTKPVNLLLAWGGATLITICIFFSLIVLFEDVSLSDGLTESLFYLVFWGFFYAFLLPSLYKESKEFQKIKRSREQRERVEIERLRKEKIERLRKEAERLRLIELRDSDTQDSPYRYDIGRHARETLALRYGIPHVGRGGDRSGRELDTILIRKTRLLEVNRYEVVLPEYRDRKAIAVIEKGTEYVKTFYPQDGSKWWDRNGDWEEVLKGNSGFTIKDMARMHIERLNQRS